MEAPNVDEAVKELIRQEYADFDIEALLGDSVEQNNAEGEEENKESERKYTIEQSRKQMYELFS